MYMNDILTSISWAISAVGLLGSYEVSKPKARVKLHTANTAYFLANILSILYFAVTLQWAFVFLNCGYMVFSIRGIHNNPNNMENNERAAGESNPRPQD